MSEQWPLFDLNEMLSFVLLFGRTRESATTTNVSLGPTLKVHFRPLLLQLEHCGLSLLFAGLTWCRASHPIREERQPSQLEYWRLRTGAATDSVAIGGMI